MKDKRESINAKCKSVRWNEVKQKDETFFPSVMCNFDCTHCGFSAEEKERRLTEGRWEERFGVRTLVFGRV